MKAAEVGRLPKGHLKGIWTTVPDEALAGLALWCGQMESLAGRCRSTGGVCVCVGGRAMEGIQERDGEAWSIGWRGCKR